MFPGQVREAEGETDGAMVLLDVAVLVALLDEVREFVWVDDKVADCDGVRVEVGVEDLDTEVLAELVGVFVAVCVGVCEGERVRD